MLLKGMCNLQFEGQSFVPDGEGTRRCWLEVSHAAGGRLSALLAPRGWISFNDDFHAEFWGTIYWGDGCGHLGMFDGYATMHELVSARFTPPVAPSGDKKYQGIKGIAGRLRAGRAKP